MKKIRPVRLREKMGIKENSYPKSQDAKDYIAISIFLLALAALFVTGYFSAKAIIKDGALTRFTAAPELMKDIGKYVEGLSDKLEKGRAFRSNKPSDASEHMVQGHRYYRKKSYREALNEYEKAVRADPENPEAHYWKGRSLLNTGQYDSATEEFKTAVTLKTDYSEAYDHLGWLSARRGDRDQSISYLTKSLELKPDNGWAHYHRGQMFLSSGELENAVKDFERACKLGFQEGCRAYDEYKVRSETK